MLRPCLPILGHLGVVLALLEPSWGVLGLSWSRLGAVLGRLGGVWGRLGASWGRLGAFLGPSWVLLSIFDRFAFRKSIPEP